MLALLWHEQIAAGNRTLDECPAKLRDEVERLIEERKWQKDGGKNGNQA